MRGFMRWLRQMSRQPHTPVREQHERDDPHVGRMSGDASDFGGETGAEVRTAELRRRAKRPE